MQIQIKVKHINIAYN